MQLITAAIDEIVHLDCVYFLMKSGCAATRTIITVSCRTNQISENEREKMLILLAGRDGCTPLYYYWLRNGELRS